MTNIVKIEEFFHKNYGGFLFWGCLGLHASEAGNTAVAFTNVSSVNLSPILTMLIAILLFGFLAGVQFVSAQAIPKFIVDLTKDRDNIGYEIASLIISCAVYLFILWAFIHINLVLDGMLEPRDMIPPFIKWIYHFDPNKVEGFVDPTIMQWKAGAISMIFIFANLLLEIAVSLNALSVGNKLRKQAALAGTVSPTSTPTPPPVTPTPTPTPTPASTGSSSSGRRSGAFGGRRRGISSSTS